MFNDARSVINKFDDLSVFMYENDPDVVFVTETWTSSDTLDSELCMTGYELYRFDRRHRRGGVVLSMRKTISMWSKLILTFLILNPFGVK